MRNCIKTLLLSTIVLVIGNNNCYSQNGDYTDFNDYFEYINKDSLNHITGNIKSYNDFYDCLTFITMDSVKISDSSIINMISEIKNVAQQAFYGNQMSVRSYVKLLCYFTLMSECERYICGDYAMLHVVKKACDEFLGEEDLVESCGSDIYDQAELQNLYNLIKQFSTNAQTRINKMQAESPNLQKDKGMKSLENITDNKVAKLMEVWDNFDNKQKNKE